MTRASRTGVAVAATAWGFAEATVFFLVPDVLLTLVACRDLRAALRAGACAVLGAIAGGMVMVVWGRTDPDGARRLLEAIPGIGPALVAGVRAQIEARGLGSVFAGPLFGVPYKIYAVEWGAHGGALVSFGMASLPARALRFVGTALLAHGIARLLGPLTRRRAKIESALWLVAWTVFYVFYFHRMGW